MDFKEKFDVAIIGGGPAGMMAAIFASDKGKKVALIEKNNMLGKKLLLTGDGRCNITNKNLENKELVKSLGKEWDFLLSGLSLFGFKKTKEFFESNGINLTEEENGKMFPEKQKSKEVLNFLLEKLKKNKVAVLLNSQVSEIKKKGNLISKIILSDGKEIVADKYILTTGGKSYPITGSTGDGFNWARLLGHTIIEPRPALSPIEIKENWVKELSGLSLQDIGLNVWVDNKIVKKWKGDILFAHFGITGPMVLDKSKEIDRLIKQGNVMLSIDLFPNINNFDDYFEKIINKNKNSSIKKILSLGIPSKLVDYVISFSKVDGNKKGNNILKQERLKIGNILKKITLHPIGLLGFDKSMVTSGGVSLKEIDSKTMRSKIIDNLFFAGEIIDLDGPCGGYNLQICWTTGHLAGINA